MRRNRRCWTRKPRPRCGACCAKNGSRQGRRNTLYKPGRWEVQMLMDASASLRGLVDFLSSVEIFSGFAREDLETLAEHTESRSFVFGETVCNAGEPAEGLFVIKSGSVRIFTEERGKEVSMGTRKERDVFAEIAMLREYRHESSVRASAKTELLFIH